MSFRPMPTAGAAYGTTSYDDAVDRPIPACIGADPELFFADTIGEITQAKAICEDCPVRLECLRGATARREPCGVWGGETFIAGVAVRPKRLMESRRQGGEQLHPIKQANLDTANIERRIQGEQARAELIAAVEELVAIGADIKRAAQLTNRSTATLERYLYRVGRADLVSALKGRKEAA